MKDSAEQGGCYPQRPKARWIMPFEICRILHILLHIQIHSKYFPVLKGVSPFRSLCFCSLKITISSPGFLGQQFNNLQWAALLTSF